MIFEIKVLFDFLEKIIFINNLEKTNKIKILLKKIFVY